MNFTETVVLKKIVGELESGGRPKGGIVDGQGNIFSLGGEHLNNHGGFNLTKERRIPLKYFNEMKRGKVKTNDILIVKDGATTGKVSFVSTNFSELPCAINEHVFRLSVKPDLAFPKYVFYYLYGAKGNKEIMMDFRGATIGGISQKFVQYVHIPLPPLPEQERIAAILDKADRLRRLCRYAIQLGDSYLQSVFLEMFGDPVTNPMGWETTTFQKSCEEIYRYPTFYGFKYSEIGVPVARIGNILAHGVLDHDLSNYVFITEEISNKYPRTVLELNDILMAVRGDGSTATRIGLVTSPNLVGANMSPNLLRFKANSKIVSPLYLFYFMTSIGGQRLIGQWVTRTAKKTITATNIKQIKFPRPTPEAQEKFVQVVKCYEHLRSQQRESLRQAEHLFQALLHQAFEGERDGQLEDQTIKAW